MYQKKIINECKSEEERNIALNKLKRDNYTLSLDTTFNVTKMEVLDEDEEKEVVKAYNYAKYYYTGNSLYYAVSQESNAFDAPNADNDLLLLDVGREKLAAYGYSETDSVEQVVFTKAAGSNFSAIDNVATYDQVTPKLNEVNASIFNYNEETNSYTICEEMMPYIASVAIVPPLTITFPIPLKVVRAIPSLESFSSKTSFSDNSYSPSAIYIVTFLSLYSLAASFALSKVLNGFSCVPLLLSSPSSDT